MADNVDIIKIGTQAQAHVDAYLEYRNIVGDLDDGKLLSQKEYEEFKKRAIERRKNRIYVTWVNNFTGMECRAVGPSSKCFCGHKFREHATDNKDKNLCCQMKRCPCKLFEYIPIRGSQDLKCHCKHSYKEHNGSTRKCIKKFASSNKLCNCDGFQSSFGCACGEPFSNHHTLFETRDERVKAGKRVDNLGGGGEGYAALGGLTTFSSLLDGVDRMDINPDGTQKKQITMSMSNGIQNIPMNALPFIPPASKLDENQEMAIYAQKYKKTPSYTKSSKNSLQKLRQKQFEEQKHQQLNLSSQSYHPQQQHQQPINDNNYNNSNKESYLNGDALKQKLKLLKQRKGALNRSRNNSQRVSSMSENDNTNNISHDNMNIQGTQAISMENQHVENPYFAGEIAKSEKLIDDLEIQIKNPKISDAKKWALKKQLKTEKAKIIRAKRKYEAEVRSFEKGLQ